jgi:hypothetical protein
MKKNFMTDWVTIIRWFGGVTNRAKMDPKESFAEADH